MTLPNIVCSRKSLLLLAAVQPERPASGYPKRGAEVWIATYFNGLDYLPGGGGA
jgi:hypothetical protein